MNKQITHYIDEAPEKQRKIMEIIRKTIHDKVPHVLEEFKWSRPVFRTNHDFAYLKTTKAYVTLGFFHAQILDDPDNLLEGTGKDMRHIKLKNVESIDIPLIEAWIKKAAQ